MAIVEDMRVVRISVCHYEWSLDEDDDSIGCYFVDDEGRRPERDVNITEPIRQLVETSDEIADYDHWDVDVWTLTEDQMNLWP
jgi:hypothetical protein